MAINDMKNAIYYIKANFLKKAYNKKRSKAFVYKSKSMADRISCPLSYAQGRTDEIVADATCAPRGE